MAELLVPGCCWGFPWQLYLRCLLYVLFVHICTKLEHASPNLEIFKCLFLGVCLWLSKLRGWPHTWKALTRGQQTLASFCPHSLIAWTGEKLLIPQGMERGLATDVLGNRILDSVRIWDNSLRQKSLASWNTALHRALLWFLRSGLSGGQQLLINGSLHLSKPPIGRFSSHSIPHCSPPGQAWPPYSDTG